MTNLTIVSRVKMENRWNFSISGLKMIRKVVEKKYFWNSSMGSPFAIKWIYLIERRNFDQKYKFSSKNDMVSAWRNFQKIFRHIYIMINETLTHKFHPYSILTGEVTVKWLTY